MLFGDKKLEYTNLSGSVNIAADTTKSNTIAIDRSDLVDKYDNKLVGGLNQYGKDVLAGKVDDKEQEGEATHL